MKILFLAVVVGGFQEEDPAHWVKFLASDKAVERDEAFIRLLKLGEKAAPALTGSKDVRAQDVLALIEKRQDKLLEILGRARDEARGDLDRLLWRAHHICVALCEEREWNPVKAILDRAKCPERGRSRDRDGLKLTYALLAPAWRSKAGARFELQLEFSIDPAPSADEASRLLMSDLDVELVLWSGAPLADLREGLSKDTFLGASVHEAADAEFALVQRASLHYKSPGPHDPPMSWEFWLWIDLKTAMGAKELNRRFEGWRVSGELKDFRMDKSEEFEPSRGSQGSVSRIDPPQVRETSDLDRLKPANCQTAYGPGDLKTLPADITGLILSGEGLLQRDFNRISRFTSLKYLELEGWKEGRRLKLDALKELSKLEALELHRLDPEGVPFVAGLASLKALKIGHCPELKEADFAKLAALPALTALDLRGAGGMTDGALRAFCAPGKLQQLDVSLREAPLTNDGLKDIGKLADLNRLYITHAKALTAEAYKPLEGLKNLREVTLGFSGVDNRVLATLGKIKSLQEIWIYGGDAVTDEGLMHMSGLPDLDYMNIDSKNTTEAGWKALRDKLPGRWRQGSAFQ